MKTTITSSGIIIDLETGGLDAKHHAVTEIGAVAFFRDGGGALVETDLLHLFVSPHDDLSVTASAARVQGQTVAGIYSRTGALHEDEAFDQLCGFVFDHLGRSKDHDGDYVPADYTGRLWAQNAQFDHSFLNAMERRSSMRKPQVFVNRNSFACTRELAKVLIGTGTIKPASSSLDDLLVYFGLSNPRHKYSHSAIEDARLTLAVLSELERAAGWRTTGR